MKNSNLSKAVCLVIVLGFFSCKTFKPAQPIPANVQAFILDSTYKLYMRSICRTAARSRLMVNGVSVFHDNCENIRDPDVLIERQYLYYSPVTKVAMFIMLIPNYPQGGNGIPTYNMPAIRNQPVVNLWNANCFLFGRVNSSGDRIDFRQWQGGLLDSWGIQIDPAGQFIEVISATERKPNIPDRVMQVSHELAVNVKYTLVTPGYPLHVDGTMFNASNINQPLQQELLYVGLQKKKYQLFIPYSDNSFAIMFNGKKVRASRLPYNITGFFR